MDYLIIGGGVAGTIAAENIRLLKPNASITILTNEKYPLYSRVQIPYYLRGIKTREQIFLRSFQSYKDKNINFLTEKNVVFINSRSSVVTTAEGDQFEFGSLLIATGGEPKRLNQFQKEHAMQTLEDADRILSEIKKARVGIIIGSGFIALEFVETFLHHGLETYLCVSKDGFWNNFLAREVSDVICKCLASKGVKIAYGEYPGFFSGSSDEIMVGTGIGIDIKKAFFDEAGLVFDKGLVTNGNLQTNVGNIYAAGDVVRFYSTKLARYVRYGNWTNASVSGKFAGMNMAGKKEHFDMLSAYSITQDKLSVVFLGSNEIDEFSQVKVKVLSDTEAVQFFVRRGKLDGCVLVNKSMDRQKYQKIIDSREEFILE
ncbi:NAD(P)/FAD-dependent oxidoreductase [candidate division WWE3 bacterium]|nr:NAD(P)/FAD-dependent oxidoreductase [candidate division WWE3 bacterium]